MGRPIFIDPTSDFGFKRIFGSEPNKELLIDFLNALFRGRKKILEIQYCSPEKIGETEEMGTVIYDLLCKGDRDEQFIIEVQRSLPKNFKKRINYYGSKLITDQAPKGARRDWSYELNEVFVIVLLDGFTLSKEQDQNSYLQDIAFCNRDTGKVFQETISFLYLELINFTKEESELKDSLDYWLYVLKNMSHMQSVPNFLSNTIFEKLFEIAQFSKLNKEEKIMYDIQLKRKWDQKAVLDQAKISGFEEGKVEGKTEGFEESTMLIARNLKNQGISIEDIMLATKLNREQIENLV